jgi:SAM-dependent methyltransferase
LVGSEHVVGPDRDEIWLPPRARSGAGAPVNVIDTVMQRTLVYRVWQAPFAERKFAPILKHNDLGKVRRVLDVGCGPGTNAHHFDGREYVGIDINPSYVESARKRHRREFRVVDVRAYEVDGGERFDFVLMNSFLHHIETKDIRRILSHVRTLLTQDGHVHVLELVLPSRRSVARRMARWDRGDYPRSLSDWNRLFSEHFEPVAVEPYPLGLPGVTLWNMVYFKGRPRT